MQLLSEEGVKSGLTDNSMVQLHRNQGSYSNMHAKHNDTPAKALSAIVASKLSSVGITHHLM